MVSNDISVVFDARSGNARRTSGWERYTREVAKELAGIPNINVHSTEIHPIGRRLLSDLQVGIQYGFRNIPIHYPTFPPLGLAAPFALTVHDLTWWRYPETASKLGLAYYRPLLERAIPRAAAIVTHTRAVADEVVEKFAIPDDRVHVVSCGVDTLLSAQAKAPHPVPQRPYILAVATIEPRKNLDRLVAAFSAIGDAGVDLRIVGRVAWGKPPPGITVMSSVSDPELKWLYQNATGVIVPSLYEGFGLPLIEALALGTPVACSDIAVFREVAPDVEMFDPLSVGDISNSVRRLIAGDSSSHDTVLARDYTWERVGRNLRDVYVGLGWITK